METALPLMIACAEFDPPRFQQQYLGLIQRRFDRHGTLPRSHVATGHYHFSLACHLGTADRRVPDEIVSFIAGSCKQRCQPPASANTRPSLCEESQGSACRRRRLRPKQDMAETPTPTSTPPANQPH